MNYDNIFGLLPRYKVYFDRHDVTQHAGVYTGHVNISPK